MPKPGFLIQILGAVAEQVIAEIRMSGGPAEPDRAVADPHACAGRALPAEPRPTARKPEPQPWLDPEIEAASGGGAHPFDTISAKYGASAIALVRPYPPREEGTGRSHIGGVPDLPSSMPWPRTREGKALHFLAQVDCADLPRLDGAPGELVPSKGTLLFFVHMDDELVFDSEPEGDQHRIIFDPASSGQPTLPPADLPNVDRHWQKHFTLPGESERSTFAYWPIVPVAIQSAPAADAFRGDWTRLADYRQGVSALRAREIERTTGLRPASDTPWPDLGILEPSQKPGKLKPVTETGFPWVAAGISLVARSVLNALREAGSDQFVEVLERFRMTAESQPAANQVTLEEAEAFAALLDDVMRSTLKTFVDKEGMTRWYPDDRIRTAIWVGAHRLVTESGGNAALAGALAPKLYEAAYPRHAPLTFNAAHPEDWDYQQVRLAQMLGYVPSTQAALPVESPLLTLLQLRTDPGLDMIIGEWGEFDFRVLPQDLAARNWSGVTLSHVGD